jgi:hypothetical protein
MADRLPNRGDLIAAVVGGPGPDWAWGVCLGHTDSGVIAVIEGRPDSFYVATFESNKISAPNWNRMERDDVRQYYEDIREHCLQWAGEQLLGSE